MLTIPGHVLVTGSTGSFGSTVGGRKIPAGAHAFLASYAEGTLALERLALFEPLLSRPNTPPFVWGLTADPAGKHATVAVAFEGGITTGLTIQAQDGSIGLALVDFFLN